MRLFDLYVRFIRRPLAGTDALLQMSLIGFFAGTITAFIIVLFRHAIEIPLYFLIPDRNPEHFETLSRIQKATLPVAGALVLGLFLYAMHIGDRKVGIAHVMDRLSNHQGYISFKSMMVQFFAGTVSIISGQSAGREGPVVHLGSACGSLMGQYMKLPNNSIRTLVACGTAAAISASFNTPIAGVIFAMEVVLMDFVITSFTPIIIASVSAAIITQSFYGSEPAFIVPEMETQSVTEIPFIILTGLAIGIASASFIQLIKVYMRYSHRNIVLRIAVAGLLTGAVAIFYPQIMGVGYDTVNQVIANEIALGVLVSVAIAKLLVTAIAVGLGMPSGLVGPTLFIGATLGGACGIIANMAWPDTPSSTGFYAMIGMASMMGACLQAPFSALLALLELTQNPNIILPAMLTIVVSSTISAELFKQKSVFLTVLQSQGLSFRNDPVFNALQRVGVGAVMERNQKRANRLLSLSAAEELLTTEPKWIIVEIDGRPASLLPAVDLARHVLEFNGGDPEQEIDLMTIPAQRKDIRSIYFQATLKEAVDRFQETGAEALYVERTSAPMIKTVLGVLTRQDIDSYYQYKK
ncbi:MAG: chloride channel protein [Gammaproteobacteria bacterium]|nr:MAG: chloride channel protein [Gammaproteobacteria bacterium]